MKKNQYFCLRYTQSFSSSACGGNEPAAHRKSVSESSADSQAGFPDGSATGKTAGIGGRFLSPRYDYTAQMS